ncbi:MAG: T9SS type A sorting domain-containing protein [Crocinitomicaceae bacterium]|nr:T9SS type A sorting domain-containing protein [Crocinitomicaceae bacterium]
MKKQLLLISGILFWAFGYAQPANDNCANATALTVDGGLSCGETTLDATLQSGFSTECFTNYAGSSETSVWYSFTANNDSMVINMIETNFPNLSPHMAVYGPNAGCLPACASQIYDELLGGDPGHHVLLTGLVNGATYLIQIQGNEGGGPNDSETNFCMGVAQPSANGYSTGANVLDECGTAFTENTDGGYWQSGTGSGFANLDNNAGTTCGGCVAGNDVTFVINNAAWNAFCSAVDGTWQITVDNVTGCTLSAPNQGIQAAVFTGSPSALVNEGQQSPIAPGGSWTSPTITVNAGECAYLMIDGFAGDVCTYDVTLTNITGGCVVLSVQFVSMTAVRAEKANILKWVVASEEDNDRFIIERSYDNENYEVIGEVQSIGDHFDEYEYEFVDDRNPAPNVYYKLSVIDNNGKQEMLAIKYLADMTDIGFENLMLYPNPAVNAVNIRFTEKAEGTPTTIEIYSQLGELVKTYHFETTTGMNDFQMNLEELDQGTYLVKIISDSKIATRTFVKR